MAANRHTCCICHQPRQPVERHHINGDPSDNRWNNLAVVCRNCHGLVTAQSSLGARYAPGEVLHYKRDWEERCSEADPEEIESPVDEIHETKVIDANEHEIYPFDMGEGDELVFSIDADGPLDLVVCDEEDAEAWADGYLGEGEEDVEYPLPAGYIHRIAISRCEDRRFTASEGRCYVLMVVNWNDEAVEVTIDAAVWKDDEE